jgi:hypothetical protein
MAATNLETAFRFLEGLSRNADAAEIEALFSPDIVQIEYPNRFTPNGARSRMATVSLFASAGSEVSPRRSEPSSRARR